MIQSIQRTSTFNALTCTRAECLYKSQSAIIFGRVRRRAPQLASSYCCLAAGTSASTSRSLLSLIGCVRRKPAFCALNRCLRVCQLKYEMTRNGTWNLCDCRVLLRKSQFPKHLHSRGCMHTVVNVVSFVTSNSIKLAPNVPGLKQARADSRMPILSASVSKRLHTRQHHLQVMSTFACCQDQHVDLEFGRNRVSWPMLEGSGRPTCSRYKIFTNTLQAATSMPS